MRYILSLRREFAEIELIAPSLKNKRVTAGIIDVKKLLYRISDRCHGKNKTLF